MLQTAVALVKFSGFPSSPFAESEIDLCRICRYVAAMPSRISRQRRTKPDANQTAAGLVRAVTGTQGGLEGALSPELEEQYRQAKAREAARKRR